MADDYGIKNTTHAFNLPSPYQAELAKIADQQRMAEMLQAQSQQPTERYSYKGIEARTPVTAGLAKALQGFSGAYFQNQAREEEKALGEKYRADQSADFTNLAKILSAPAVAASAGVPERPAEPPTMPVDDKGNAMPDVSAAPAVPDVSAAPTMPGVSAAPAVPGVSAAPAVPAVPAVAARRAGQIDPEMIGQFKTPEMRQMAMAQLLAQIGPEKLTEVGKGGSLYSQKQGKVVFTAPNEEEYGTTPTIYKDSTSPTGYVGRLYSKTGQVKELGPINPVNQFTTGTVDAALKRGMDMYQFGNLSADQRASLGIKLTQAGVDVAKLNFDTGQGSARQPPLPANAPVPNFSTQTVPSAGAGQTTQPVGQPVAPVAVPGATPAAPGQPVGQPVAPVAVPTAPRIGMAPARAAQSAVPAFAPNAVGPNGQIVQTAAGAVPLTGKERQRLAGVAVESQQNKEQKMAGFGDAIAEARQILTGTNPVTGIPGTKPLPTASGVGSLVDYLGNLGGVAPKGQNEAKRLEAIAGILTSKVPRMEGQQSNQDVELYKQMAGDVGNSRLPISTRLSALDTVQKLFSKYEKPNSDQPQIGVSGAVPLQPFQGQNRRAPDANVIRYNEQGVRQQ